MKRCQKCNKRIWPWNWSTLSDIPQFIDPYKITKENRKYLGRYLTNTQYYHKKCNPVLKMINEYDNNSSK